MSLPVGRTVTPNSLPALGKLCIYCKNLDFRALFQSEPGEYQRHESLDDLLNSATSGCGLCQLFRYSSEIDPQDRYDIVKAGGRIFVEGPWRLRSTILVGNIPKVGRIWGSGNLCTVDPFIIRDPGIGPGGSHPLSLLAWQPMGPESSSDITFSKISSWFEECCTYHTACERPTALPMPSRVLDLGTSSERQRLCLITSEGKRGQWVALSHDWGGFQPLRTTKETLAVHQAGIKWSELPPTFQDAIAITRKLGFRYLWIDSLCIIQNSPECELSSMLTPSFLGSRERDWSRDLSRELFKQLAVMQSSRNDSELSLGSRIFPFLFFAILICSRDWDREAATMASVYGNAAITICAEAAANSQCGIFKSANKRRGIEVRLPANSPHNSFEYDIYLAARPPKSNQDFHIGYRAWVLQEFLLSSRVIIYAADQVYWSCRVGEKSERGENYLPESLGVVQFGSSEKSLLFPTTGFDCCDDKLTQPLAPMRIKKTPFKPKGYLDYASQHKALLKCWYRIVENYVACSITKAEDRLPAIAGIAKRISALTGYSYLAGLWLEDIVRGLCWYSHDEIQTSSKYVCPTWSWAALTCLPADPYRGTFTHPDVGEFVVAEEIKLEDINIKYATADEFMQVQEGSSLRITGLCCGGGYIIQQHRGWGFFMSGKLQFTLWNNNLNSGGSPADRKLTYLRLGHSVSGVLEVYLLILEMSPADSEKYVRTGLARVPLKTWEQMDLKFWSVQSLTII